VAWLIDVFRARIPVAKPTRPRYAALVSQVYVPRFRDFALTEALKAVLNRKGPHADIFFAPDAEEAIIRGDQKIYRLHPTGKREEIGDWQVMEFVGTSAKIDAGRS
jgi:hypothetical protein